MTRKILPVLILAGALLDGAVFAQTAAPPTPNAPVEAKAQALEPIVTDRPDYTESTDTVPAGMTQIEGGYTYTKNDNHNTTQSLGEILIRVAAGNKAEVRIGLNSYDSLRGQAGQGYGLEDADIGVKVRIKPGTENSGFRKAAVSIIGLVSLPTGTGAERGTDLQPTIKLLLGYSFSSRVDLGVNANYAYVSDSSNHYSEMQSSASLGYAITKRLGSYVEYYGFYPLREQTATHYLNTGLSYLINDNTQIDVRIGTGLGGPADKNFIGTGASVRF
jgi:hypothetical protein